MLLGLATTFFLPSLAIPLFLFFFFQLSLLRTPTFFFFFLSFLCKQRMQKPKGYILQMTKTWRTRYSINPIPLLVFIFFFFSFLLLLANLIDCVILARLQIELTTLTVSLWLLHLTQTTPTLTNNTKLAKLLGCLSALLFWCRHVIHLKQMSSPVHDVDFVLFVFVNNMTLIYFFFLDTLCRLLMQWFCCCSFSFFGYLFTF